MWDEYEVVLLTRQELYDQVWTTPMKLLAPKWNLSDVGLAKICKRHKIPRPSLGYWAKKQNGKRVQKTPLPAVKDEQLNTVRIEVVKVKRTFKRQIIDEEIAQLIRREAQPEWAITVDENLEIRHPFLKASTKYLEGQPLDKYGRISPKPKNPERCEPYFRMDVSPPNVTRALRILQAFTTAMEARGYELKVKHRSPYFDVMGTEFRMTVREHCIRTRRPHDPLDYRLTHLERYKYTLTGNLILWANYSASTGCDSEIRDTKETQIESRLNEMIVGLFRVVNRNRIREIERRRQENIEAQERKIEAQRKEIEAQQRAEQELKRRTKRVRVRRLHQLTKRWETHKRLKAFVDAVRASVESRSSEIDPETVKWLEWADGYLAKLNPLCDGESLPVYALTDEELAEIRFRL